MISEKEIEDWYNQRHLSKGENSWRSYEAYPIYLEYLNVKSGKKLLDIGCGTGYLLKVADQRGLETYGVDISMEGVKIAKDISPGSKISCGKGEDLKFPDNYFDYITCIGALEHFLDIKKGLREMLRVAKDDTSFCMVVPNSNFLPWKLGIKKGTEQQDINENLMSLKQWKNIFTEEGFKILEIYKDKWFMKGIFNKIMWIFLPLNFTYQFIFILRKK